MIATKKSTTEMMRTTRRETSQSNNSTSSTDDMIKNRSGSDEPRYAVPEAIKENEYETVVKRDLPISPYRSQALNTTRNSYVPPQFC